MTYTFKELMGYRYWVEDGEDDMSEVVFATNSLEEAERYIAEDEFPELLTLTDTEEGL